MPKNAPQPILQSHKFASPNPQSLHIVFDHTSFVVVNKPPGIAVHSHVARTLLDQVRDYFSNDDIHPVHRLDLATSGLVVFAKTSDANRQLCQAFALQQVQKIYLALTTEKPKKKQGWIKGDMQKTRGGSYKLLHSQNNPAITYALSFGCEGEPRLWLLRPKSGKTHQLRVALKSLGAPILGDKRYGDAQTNKTDTLCLHALAIKFTLAQVDYAFEVKPTFGSALTCPATQQRLERLGDVWAQTWPKGL